VKDGDADLAIGVDVWVEEGRVELHLKGVQWVVRWLGGVRERIDQLRQGRGDHPTTDSEKQAVTRRKGTKREGLQSEAGEDTREDVQS
jgi:hypothetical protein